MMDVIVSGLWAGYGLAVPVGAVAVLMINMTVREGFRTGAAAALGATSADGLYALAAVLGGSVIAAAVQPISGPLRWAAALILLGMAVRVFLSAIRRPASPESGDAPEQRRTLTRARAFFAYFGLTALNPWPAIYFVALVLGLQAQGQMGFAERVAYIAAIVAASASWQLFLAAGAAVLGKAVTGPRGRLVTALASSILISALAVSMAVG